jgi:activator of HSP90 ATPase
MAKWGEGDPRWLVQERNDGANVNGWHWQEKNCMGWGKERLTQLVTALSFDLPNDEGAAKITEISKFEGDASVNTRKGNKKFAVFDLAVTCKWEGACKDFEGAVKGEIKLTEFASTNDEDEYEFKVTASDGDKGAKDKMMQKINSAVAKSFLPLLATWVKELSEM